MRSSLLLIIVFLSTSVFGGYSDQEVEIDMEEQQSLDLSDLKGLGENGEDSAFWSRGPVDEGEVVETAGATCLSWRFVRTGGAYKCGWTTICYHGYRVCTAYTDGSGSVKKPRSTPPRDREDR